MSDGYQPAPLVERHLTNASLKEPRNIFYPKLVRPEMGKSAISLVIFKCYVACEHQINGHGRPTASRWQRNRQLPQARYLLEHKNDFCHAEFLVTGRISVGAIKRKGLHSGQHLQTYDQIS